MTPTPSPLPWDYDLHNRHIVSGDGEILFVATSDAIEDDLLLITQAVNERAGLLALLREAAEVIDGLAGQQAMEDNWYEEPLARVRAVLDQAEK